MSIIHASEYSSIFFKKEPILTEAPNYINFLITTIVGGAILKENSCIITPIKTLRLNNIHSSYGSKKMNQNIDFVTRFLFELFMIICSKPIWCLDSILVIEIIRIHIMNPAKVKNHLLERNFDRYQNWKRE